MMAFHHTLLPPGLAYSRRRLCRPGDVRLLRVSRWLLCVALWAFVACVSARADTFGTPDPGPGMVPITGEWQFHTGDNPVWALPSLDDSGWSQLRSNAPWGMQGFPGYTGYAWYRKRVDIGPGLTPLGLYIPAADGAYEVYWDGRKIGSSGNLPPRATWYLLGKDAVFPLHPEDVRTSVLALRFWVPPLSPKDDPADGGLHGSPRLGGLDLLQQQLQFHTLITEHRAFPMMVAGAVMGVGGVISLLLFLRKRRERLYLWFSLLLFGDALQVVANLSKQSVPFVPSQILVQLQATGRDIGLWLVLLWVFGLHRSSRWKKATGWVIAVYLAAQLIDCICIWFLQYGHTAVRLTDVVTTQIIIGLEGYLLILVGFGLVRHRASHLVPLSVIAVLGGGYNFLLDLILLVRPGAVNEIRSWNLQLGAYHFSALTILGWLLILSLSLTVAGQQIRESRRQAHLEQEIRSAKEVQHVLIPEQIPPVPGLTIASVYRPALEVGGDFFQVIPPAPGDASEGTLIVVGDVSGKGLKAAMTVSLIVGTLRTLASFTRSPSVILQDLNQRLLGRHQDDFSTCVVVHMDPNGTVTLANAGHLAPFRDGLEMHVPPSLPLGLVPEPDYQEIYFKVDNAGTLTLITDGVLEARDRKGEIFGFERVAALMRGRPTPEQIAEAACSFGQADDITIVSITCRPDLQPRIGSATPSAMVS